MHTSKVSCPSCDRSIVPKIVMLGGEPHKSFCPFCGSTVREFQEESYWTPPRVVFVGFFLLAALGWLIEDPSDKKPVETVAQFQARMAEEISSGKFIPDPPSELPPQ